MDLEGMLLGTKGKAAVRRLHPKVDLFVVCRGQAKHNPAQCGSEGSVASLSVTLLGFMAAGVCLFVWFASLFDWFVCLCCSLYVCCWCLFVRLFV
jgi:hypothetical protein